MKRVIDVDDILYKACKRLVSEGDPRPSESCIANSKPYEPQGDWVHVSERLPEEKIDPMTNDFALVLCSTLWGAVRIYKYGKPIGRDKAHFWDYGAIMDEYIVAWQPLPEPYMK